MNFFFLTQKYFPHAKVIVHDRTYEGLEWISPGHKPKEAVFQSFQDEEDRLARMAGREVMSRDSQMQEKQRQARAQAQADLTPFQQVLGEYFESERLRFQKLLEDALEAKAMIALKEHAMHAWQEITEAQDALNAKAQEYLEETKHYLAWDTHKIPPDVLVKREEAHKMLDGGKTVYADWATLRAAEMPSREEIQQAVLSGGEHLARIKKACKEVSLKYPKPRKQHT